MTPAADLAARLRVTQAHVLLDGTRVAALRHAGRVITVRLPDGRAIGRLMPRGYDQGAPDDGSGLVDAWTALHPSAPAPGDAPLGRGLTPAEGVALLLSRGALYSLP